MWRICRSVMKLCRSALIVPLLLIITTGCESAATVVKVEYNGTAVLPCSGKCSDLVKWIKTNDLLAECDQTSCRTVKEGYQMIYNQYRQGDLSLIITEADFSKSGHYTCDCDGRDQCDVLLQVEARRSSLQVQSGGSLELNLYTSKLVEVIYNSTGAADGSSGQICTVIWGLLGCKSEYTHRTSLSSSDVLELRDMEESDSGVYTIWDMSNEEDIHIYTVTVTARRISVQRQSGESLVMELEVSDPVEVIYYSTGAADGSSGQICTVIGRLLQCESEYTNRTSLSSALVLRDMKESDRGDYIIRNTSNKEDIYIYTVTVTGDGGGEGSTSAQRTSYQMKPGGSLVMEWKVSDPVEVVYRRTGAADGSSVQIYTVDGVSLQCESEYTNRTSLLSVLELRDMKGSDSGVYTVRNNSSKEDIHIYTVTVTGVDPLWWLLIIPVVLYLVVLVGIVWQRRMIVQLSMELERMVLNQFSANSCAISAEASVLKNGDLQASENH